MSPRSRFQPRLVVAVGLMVGIALAGVAVVIFALVSKEPPTRSHLHLPSVDQIKGLVTGPQACPDRIYPAGAQYAFERCSNSGDPIGWARCSTVTYSVDPANAPAGYATDLDSALARLRSATGLHFVQVARSGQIRIAWDPSLFDPQPGASGEAGVTDYETASDLSGSHPDHASIKVSAHLAVGGAPGVGERPVLLHELGHAVGLAHFSGPEVMNPLDRGYTSYQSGDLAGLEALYHPASC